MPHWTLVRANGEPPKILVRVNTDVITKTTRTCANRGGGATRGRGHQPEIVAQHDQQSQEQQQQQQPHQHQQQHQHQQHIPRHYCVAMALCDLLSQHMSSVMMPFCCVLEHVCNTATQQQRAPPPAGDEREEEDEDEILLAALHGILDAFDCIGGIRRVPRFSMQQQQQQIATSRNRSSGAPSQHHQDPVTDGLVAATTTPSSTTPPLLCISATSTTQPPPAPATLSSATTTCHIKHIFDAWQ
uniref:Uncharacterized protein n=2 Tax=Bodo saltans TaxID=75058 RepID=A0A0S4J176_BODSA|nr:Hypothetical protein, putative [Bodo saltans]|eukprot:CUG06908.1 Hypothetical protein, putative [Bodo saltans]